VLSMTRLMNAPVGVQRLMAITLPLIAILLSIWVVDLLVRDHRESIAEIVQKRERLGQLQSVARMEPALRNSDAQQRQETNEALFLSGPSEAVILADLQGRINTLAQTSAANVQSIANLPSIESAGVRYVGLTVDLIGTHEDVMSLIYALETSTPFLIIRNGSMRAQEVVGASGQPLPNNMYVQLDVSGALAPNQNSGGGT